MHRNVNDVRKETSKKRTLQREENKTRKKTFMNVHKIQRSGGRRSIACDGRRREVIKKKEKQEKN